MSELLLDLYGVSLLRYNAPYGTSRFQVSVGRGSVNLTTDELRIFLLRAYDRVFGTLDQAARHGASG